MASQSQLECFSVSWLYTILNDVIVVQALNSGVSRTNSTGQRRVNKEATILRVNLCYALSIVPSIMVSPDNLSCEYCQVAAKAKMLRSSAAFTMTAMLWTAICK